MLRCLGTLVQAPVPGQPRAILAKDHCEQLFDADSETFPALPGIDREEKLADVHRRTGRYSVSLHFEREIGAAERTRKEFDEERDPSAANSTRG